jgi:hypothetical protein
MTASRLFKALLIALAALVVSCGIGLVVVGYLNDQERSWLVYYNLPFEVAVPQVKRGEFVPVRVSRCNTSARTHSYVVDRSFEDVISRQPRSRSSSVFLMPPGCEDSVAHAAQVPPDIEQGRYRLVGITEVHTEHRTIFIDWASTEFDVIP